MAWAHTTGLDFSEERLISCPSGESNSFKSVTELIGNEICKLNTRAEGNGQNLRLAKVDASGRSRRCC